MPTRNPANHRTDELRSEYDLGKLTGRTQGKYHARATAGTTLVLLEPDVAKAFQDGTAVNKALRVFLRMERAKLPSPRRPAKKRAGRRG